MSSITKKILVRLDIVGYCLEKLHGIMKKCKDLDIVSLCFLFCVNCILILMI